MTVPVRRGAGRARRAGARRAARQPRALAGRRARRRRSRSDSLVVDGADLARARARRRRADRRSARCRWPGCAVRHRGPISTLLERSTYFGSALPGHRRRAGAGHGDDPLRPAALPDHGDAARGLRRSSSSRSRWSASARRSPRPRRSSTTSPARSASARSARLRRVTLPLVAPGLGAGAALVFLAVVTELTATLLLAPIGTQTLATEFWANSSSIAYGAAAPYAALMVLISAPATLLLTRRAARGPAS